MVNSFISLNSTVPPNLGDIKHVGRVGHPHLVPLHLCNDLVNNGLCGTGLTDVQGPQHGLVGL